MNNSNELINRINEKYSSMSKGQKLLSTYITDNYDKAVFLTAEKLGKVVGVSESTVVRFAAELGYDGYPAMQKALQEMIRSKLTSIQRIEVSNDRIGNQDILSMVMQSDMDKIHMTLEETNREDFDRAVSAIVDARHIYILGVRSAAALASFLGFYFNLIFDNVVNVTAGTASEMFEHLLRGGEDDVVIGANAVVLEGCRVGKGAVVAAGAVVVSDVAPNTVVAGVPARLLRPLTEEELQ